jgi:hypothetical protein
LLHSNCQWLQLLLAGRGAVAQLLRDVGDEAVDPLELDVGQLVDKGALVFGSPGVVILVVLEQLLELVVLDVLGLPWRVDAPAQGGSELHGGGGGSDRLTAGQLHKNAAATEQWRAYKYRVPLGILRRRCWSGFDVGRWSARVLAAANRGPIAAHV